MTNKSIYIRLLLLLVFTNFIFNISKAQDRQLIDKVVAQVGSELILLSDIETDFNYYKSQNQPVTSETKCMILEQIMAQKLLIDQARLDSIEISDEQVEGQLDMRMDAILQRMGGDEDLFRQYYGKSVDEMKSIYREDIRNGLMAEMEQDQLMEDINITPSEVTEFFNNIPKDSLPYFNSEVELSQIIVAPVVNNEEKTKALDKIKSIREELVNGANFEELAKKYSDDPGSSSRGGDLGWVKRGSFVPKFEAVAYVLKKGELSDVVETEYGYHIIQLIERRGNNIHAKHILIKPKITTADLKLAQQKLDSIRNLIISDSMKFEVAVKKFSDPKSASYSNNGRMTNQSSQSTFFEMNELAPDVYFSIENVKPGELTPVLETTNEMGEPRYQVLKVESKSEPHRADIHRDYGRISTYAKNSKKNEYINNWVENKVKSVYLYVDPSFADFCPNIKRWLSINESQ
ncbi:MAG: peptidylprolyl isomerase [Saprospiraceae bacterium]